jgi:predicted TIM-barrel fold metal-dependent hydrolase
VTRQIRECLGPDPDPRTPTFQLPTGTVDTHVHVFDSAYPFDPGRGYTPPESDLDDLRHLHSTLGIDRVVFTQPSVYGIDNTAIVEAMATLNAETPGRARAVIACSLDIGDDDLLAFDSIGVRGVRLNTDNVGGMPITMDEIPHLCARIAPLGWHIEFLFPGQDIVELMPVFRRLTVPMSIGHFAYQPAVAGIDTPGFRALLELARDGNTWIKISGANRVSATDLPPYDDVRPMAHALVEAAPERIMWGTDWPHPNKYEINPNDGDLVDAVGDWIRDDGLRQKVLVDNPVSFYRF